MTMPAAGLTLAIRLPNADVMDIWQKAAGLA
jgi:hypothetical protein